MAVKDSDQIATDSNYALGDYSFRIERSSVPGSTNDKIEAICTQGGKNARKSIQIPSSTQMSGWYVEANETTADVYAIIKSAYKGNLTPPIPTIGGSFSTSRVHDSDGAIVNTNNIGNAVAIVCQSGDTITWHWIATSAFTISRTVTTIPVEGEPVVRQDTLVPSSTNVYGKPVHYTVFTSVNAHEFTSIPTTPISGTANSYDYYNVLYGDLVDEDVLVGRFAIDIEDAGGVGPGSDWIDPGDYDPDWEPDDPTHTLYVEVTGALSGRHNDPIEDPSYSYIPADKDTVKDYGCGGDGGHGGGGGAGASTVVVHKFATNQANNKEVTAIARRHGYGSGGGKGGKGGDGCILVYY